MELVKAAFVVAMFTFLISISVSSHELAAIPKQWSAPKSWEIEITSTGGFHGLGEGGITIKSNGMATVSDLSKSCALRIPLETLQDLERTLNDWESDLQETPGSDLNRDDALPVISANPRCCDLITYSLRIRLSRADLVERQYSAAWSQYLEGALPKSLSLVRREALQLRESLLMKCKG